MALPGRTRFQRGTALQKMAHRLKTPRGRKLYALRKQTPEPVFGIIKSVMGYRQAMLRGLENVKDEWNFGVQRQALPHQRSSSDAWRWSSAG